MGLAFSHEGGWGGTWRRGVKKCASTCWDLVTRSPPDQNSGGWWRISEHGVRAGRPHAVHVTASRKAWSGAWHVTSMHAEVWSGGTVQGALEQWVSHQGCKLRPTARPGGSAERPPFQPQEIRPVQFCQVPQFFQRKWKSRFYVNFSNS